MTIPLALLEFWFIVKKPFVNLFSNFHWFICMDFIGYLWPHWKMITWLAIAEWWCGCIFASEWRWNFQREYINNFRRNPLSNIPLSIFVWVCHHTSSYSFLRPSCPISTEVLILKFWAIFPRLFWASAFPGEGFMIFLGSYRVAGSAADFSKIFTILKSSKLSFSFQIFVFKRQFLRNFSIQTIF